MAGPGAPYLYSWRWRKCRVSRGLGRQNWAVRTCRQELPSEAVGGDLGQIALSR